MRTLLLSVFLLGITPCVLQAQQSVPMYKGATTITAGVGLHSFLSSGWEDMIGYTPYGLPEPEKSPVYQAAVGKGLGDYTSLSLFFGYGTIKYTDTYYDYTKKKEVTESYTDKIRLFGLKGQYHLYDRFNAPLALDPYVAVGGGLKLIKDARLNGDQTYSIFYMTHIGARYYIHPSASIYAELGLGTALFNTGLSLRF